MSLSGEERGALHAALLGALGGDLGELVQMVSIKLNITLADVVTLPKPLKDVVFDLIVWAEEDTDCRLIELLKGAPDYLPNPTLKIVAQMLLGRLSQAAPVTAGENPFKTCFVRLDRAFVDRKDLREELERMVPAEGNRVLVVNGQAKSGKTYTLELILHASKALPGYLESIRKPSHAPVFPGIPEVQAASSDCFEVAWLDLRREKPAGSDYTPDMLLRSLAVQMKIDPSGIPTAPALGRWAQELRDWLIQRLDRKGPVWWIVLDGVSQVRVNDPIHDFIEELAYQAEMVLDRLRIVLISYGRNLKSILGRYRKEEIGPINLTDLIEFFGKVRDARGLPPDPAADQQLAMALHQEVSAKKRAHRLRCLEERLKEKVREMLPAAGAAGKGPAAATGMGAARAGAGGGQV
jgi:hypothetical protein